MIRSKLVGKKRSGLSFVLVTVKKSTGNYIFRHPLRVQANADSSI
jgi:hypothetical protein